jgi:hypothetical protein
MRNGSIRLQVGLIGTGVVAAVVSLAAPATASAASSHPTHLVAVATRHGLVTTDSSSFGTSTSNAGYFSGPTGSSVSFTVDITVPQVQCDSSVTAPTFIDALINGELPNSSLATSGLAGYITCNGTSPAYSVALEDDSASRSFGVTPGQKIELDGAVTATSEHYTVKGLIAGRTISFTGSGYTGFDLQDTTQYGFGAGGFPPFQNQLYSNLTVDGQAFATTSTSGLTQVDDEGNTLVQASPLSANGRAFALTYVTNVADPQ